MNTRIAYMYRDADNYKQSTALILAGTFNPEELKLVKEDTEFFIPSQCGLPGLQERFNDYPTEADHPYHEILTIEQVDNPPTIGTTTQEFIKGFKKHRHKWH